VGFAFAFFLIVPAPGAPSRSGASSMVTAFPAPWLVRNNNVDLIVRLSKYVAADDVAPYISWATT
jgi:hypothetical protein